MKRFATIFFCAFSILGANLLANDDTPPKELLQLLHDHTPLKPTKVFDDVYCLGTKSVVAYAITTSGGIILIDAMWDNDDAKVIEDGLKAYNLDPKDVKIILITHGHGDHYGGAKYFQDKYNAKVMMSAIDKDFMYSYNEGPNDPKYPKPTINHLLKDKEIIKLGNKEIKTFLTPGHTIGTTSIIFESSFNGKKFNVFLWGGNGISKDKNLQIAYDKSLDEFKKELDKNNVVAKLESHLFQDNGYEKLENIYNNNFKTHPYIIGKEGIDAWYKEYKGHIKAKLNNN
ncbi:MBL fold metallo-hydrolase [Campylobacter sp. MG1]|uniref:MBL fold metallo-hydrolase n=1 Tax=Campylobacter sp. MG1 TaxID=2976332 RepID=UPI00226C7902|nr:MBL fold metallo-hydrolase [Campylobacter sp. MG1]